ncbi:MAG: hypothetical protein U5L03_10210 [Burkholderiaceae bacterium]|nr:hypothetical protein [Burkholderiaceae bacterium]
MKILRLRLSHVALVAVLPLLATAATAAAKDEPAPHPASALVKRADHARRANLEDARRLADEALALIAAQPGRKGSAKGVRLPWHYL